MNGRCHGGLPSVRSRAWVGDDLDGALEAILGLPRSDCTLELTVWRSFRDRSRSNLKSWPHANNLADEDECGFIQRLDVLRQLLDNDLLN